MNKDSTVPFKITFKGFEKRAVLNELKNLEKEIQDKDLLIETYNKRMKELYKEVTDLKQTLIIAKAQIAKANSTQTVLKEANLIIEAAQNNADEIINEALASAKILLLEVARLNKELGFAKEEVQEKLLKIEAILASINLSEPPNMAWLKEI